MARKPAYEELKQKVEELETKLAQRQREEREIIRLSKAVENSSNAIGIADLNGFSLHHNKAFVALTGYTVDQLNNAGGPSVLYSDPALGQKILAIIGSGESWSGEAWIVTRDGRTLLNDVRADAISDDEGDIIGLIGIHSDITERKRADDALWESERKYRILFEQSKDAICITNRDGKFVDFNQSAQDLFGYTKGEMMEMSIIDTYMNPNDIRKITQEINEKGFLKDYEIKLRKKDNTEIACLFNTTIKRDENGKAVGLQGIIRDITKQKRAEEAMQESEERYRTLAHNIPGMVYRGRPDWSVELVSGSKEVCGYSVEELSSQKASWLDIIHPDDRERVLKEAVKLHKQPIDVILEYRILDKDGSIRWVEDTKTSFFSEEGVFQGVDGVVYDITKRKQAEESLHLQAEITANMLEGVFLVRANDGVIVYTNPKFVEMFGYGSDEMIGQHVSIVNAPTERSPEETTKELMEHMNKHGRWQGELKSLRKDGTPFWCYVSISMFDHSKHGSVLVAVHTDITERKQAEEERKKLEAQLLQAQKMEAMGTLAGGIAHDFNNLLMGILGNASVMLAKMESANPDYEKLRTIEKLVRSGSNLTSQLLGYARKGRYVVKPINLNQLVEESTETFGRTRKEISIHQDLAEDLFAVEAEEGQIEQVLFNLYVNAADAMPSGGNLILKTRNSAHEEMKGKVYQPKTGSYVVLEVTDTGVGMDKKTVNRIFDPFFTTKEMGRGTGLGLASAYGIIKGHGGYIEADSEEGKGTTFTVYLPATEKRVEKTVTAREQIVRGSETILLVDDEELIRDVGGLMLPEIGYKVLLARSGEEAIKIYKEKGEEIDLVILDMVMPGMGGGETYDGLKEVDPEIKVLLASGYSIDGKAQEILDRGCNGFIQKPFDMAELSKAISAALKKQ